MISLKLAGSVLTVFWAASSSMLYAQDQRSRPHLPEHSHELAGFLLRQDQQAFEAALGKPFAQEKRDNDNIAFAYQLPGFKKNYLVAYINQGSSPEVHGKAVELELTGTEPSGPTGFFGLELGDSAEKVEQTLGKPTQIRHEDDVNVDLWDYAQANYTVEITADHKLYSIQIIDQPGPDDSGIAGAADARRFAQAVLDGDLETVLKMSSGEIECYVNGEYYGLHAGAARKTLADAKDGMSICLRRAAKAVMALGPEIKGADDQLRIWEKHSPGMVTKFPSTSPLQEIVFDQEAGAWRIYEVTFRDPAK